MMPSSAAAADFVRFGVTFLWPAAEVNHDGTPGSIAVQFIQGCINENGPFGLHDHIAAMDMAEDVEARSDPHHCLEQFCTSGVVARTPFAVKNSVRRAMRDEDICVYRNRGPDSGSGRVRDVAECPTVQWCYRRTPQIQPGNLGRLINEQRGVGELPSQSRILLERVFVIPRNHDFASMR